MIAFLIGTATGVLSGFGVGGGTLLLIYMTAVAGLPQTMAQGINLLYFLPTAALALPAHVKNGFLEKRLLFHSVLSGLIGTALAAYVATALDVALLHRFFGFFLILVGISELFQNPKRKNEMDRRN